MSSTVVYTPDPQRDLVLERLVDIPRERVWAAWTTPAQLLKWFTPDPWQTIDCEIELRPGGIFRTVMRSPEGEEFPGTGCYLEVVPPMRLAWTNALLPGFRPPLAPAARTEHDFAFTAVLTLEARGDATLYRTLAIHASEADCQRHAAMGFHEGWGRALDQLVETVRGLR